jgi:hypothetical protein
MRYRSSLVTLAFAALLAMVSAAQAFDDSKYPDWKGQWVRARPPHPGGGQPPFDPTRPVGRGQQAPLTPEYQKVFETNLAEQAQGGQGNWQGGRCYPVGMPGVMTLYRAMEIVITPDTTHIMIDHIRGTNRRVFTDGRDWPKEVEPGFDGYSIGQWIDEDGDGKYDVLEVETRFLRGPRAYDPSGLPFHEDNQTVVKERFYLDKADPNLMHNDMTVLDHALTRPWTVNKKYARDKNPKPMWFEDICNEGQMLVQIGKEEYLLSGDGLLMPSKKGQQPPNLKYFTAGQR